MIDIDINQSDVNQCASDQQLFSESNKCLPETTQVSIVTQAWNLHLQKYIFFLMKILDENSAISWFFFLILITYIHMKKKILDIIIALFVDSSVFIYLVGD